MSQEDAGDVGEEYYSRKYYSSNDTVVAYNLEQTISDVLMSAAKKVNVKIFWASCITDLIAIPAFMNIVNPMSLSDAETLEISQWFAYMKEAEQPRSMSIVFTSVPLFKVPPSIRKFIIRTPEVIDEDYLKLTILNKRSSAIRHSNQHGSYDRKIFRLLKIMKVLKSDGVLFLENMCNEFNVSPKTIHRDIELWNALGEFVEYDRSKKGYVLVCPEGFTYDLRHL